MAKDTDGRRHAAILDIRKLPNAIDLLRKRIDELNALLLSPSSDEVGDAVLISQKNKTNDTLSRIFGLNSQEYYTYACRSLQANLLTMNEHERTISYRLPAIRQAIKSQVINLKTVIEILEERLSDTSENRDSRILQAYEGLSLHPEIERASSQLFQDGHYANAIEAAVKALNALVRLRSDIQLDGTALIEKAFSPRSPVLRFNSMEDQSAIDEQKGYMQLFSGAVSGLRNPRAHGFVRDEPERALEFIAFVSLLGKLLDGAEKVS